MSRKHNTKHNRSRSAYSRKGKSADADTYGDYKEGRQTSADKVAGTNSYKEQKGGKK